MISLDKLIQKIHHVFDGVTLEDGIGLHEGQGLDDYATPEECKKLREKDEKLDWKKVQVLDLYQCNTSLSFFDAKGMRFHLAPFLLRALNVYQKEEEMLIHLNTSGIELVPDVEFHLCSVLKYLNDDSKQGKKMLDYHQRRFSLLNKEQIECIILFLEYKLQEQEHLLLSSSVYFDEYQYEELQAGVKYWSSKQE